METAKLNQVLQSLAFRIVGGMEYYEALDKTIDGFDLFPLEAEDIIAAFDNPQKPTQNDEMDLDAKDLLEDIIQAHGLSSVMAEMSEICNRKAAQILYG